MIECTKSRPALIPRGNFEWVVFCSSDGKEDPLIWGVADIAALAPDGTIAPARESTRWCQPHLIALHTAAAIARMQEQCVLTGGRKADYALGIVPGMYRGLKSLDRAFVD